MADGQEQIVEQTEQNNALAEQMAIALGNGVVPAQTQEVDTNTQQEAIEQGKQQATPEPTPFTFDILKDKFGYGSPDEVLADIENLRNYKATPHTPEPIKFENTQSELLFKAIQAGKQDEVFKVLAEQQKLENLTSTEVTRDSAGDIIKLSMQLKYKDLSPSEIEYKFNKQYALPKQPIFNDSIETEDEYNEKLENWKEQVADIEMNKIIEAKLAKPELEVAKSKIVFPTFDNPVDEGYAQYQKLLTETAEFEQKTKEAYKTITSKDVLTKVPFIDEANNVKFDFVYEPDSESFKKAVEIASDNEKFFNTFLNSDGSPNRQLWVDAILYATNKQHIITEAIKQGSNARIKSQLPDNDSGGLIRQLPQEQSQNELDMYMQASGIKVGR